MIRRLFFLVLAVTCLPPAARAAAPDGSKDEDRANFQYQSVTTPEGLTFRVPEDMPIEKRNGIVAPIPFDEYMYGKFKQMDQRLKTIDERLERIEELLTRQRKEDTARTQVLASS